MFFMNQIKLIVSDLDGTLLDDNKNIDTKIKFVIETLRSKDILFTIATGRNYSLSKEIVAELNIDIPYICDNGGSVFKHNICINFNKISYKNIKIISEILDKHKVPYVVYGFKYLYSPRTSEKIKSFLDKIHDIRKIDSLFELKSDNVVKITVDSKNIENFEKIKSEIDTSCKAIAFNKSEDALYTITNIKSTKGLGLVYLVNELGLSLDNVLAIGDNYNDYSMLELSNVSVSMLDSKNELKKISDYNIGSNNNNGVSNFIIDYFNL